MANRTSFVVDGFNLYHSLKQVSKQQPNPIPCRWLDLRGLCADSLSAIGNGATLESVYYFSALARHLEATNPGLVARHETYAAAITGTGVRTQFANFLEKDMWCPNCKTGFKRHEEKQTDVAVGVQIVETALRGEAETIVVVSGDSDLIPAIRATRRNFPSVQIWMAFPAGKGGKQLRKATHGAFTFSSKQYAAHQLPDSILLPNARWVYKPSKW
jgi:hypothetical protein